MLRGFFLPEGQEKLPKNDDNKCRKNVIVIGCLRLEERERAKRESSTREENPSQSGLYQKCPVLRRFRQVSWRRDIRS